MGYYSFMGYGMKIPANQVGGPMRLWVIKGYGLWQVRLYTIRVISFSINPSKIFEAQLVSSTTRIHGQGRLRENIVTV